MHLEQSLRSGRPPSSPENVELTLTPQVSSHPHAVLRSMYLKYSIELSKILQVLDRSKDPSYHGDVQLMIFNVPLKTRDEKTKVDCTTPDSTMKIHTCFDRFLLEHFVLGFSLISEFASWASS